MGCCCQGKELCSSGEQGIIQMEIRLSDPGLVENDQSEMRCLHACAQMAFRGAQCKTIPSFDELSLVLDAPEGKYAWSYPLLVHFQKCGFKVQLIEMLQIKKLIASPEEYLIEFFGEMVGRDQIQNSNISKVVVSAKELLMAGVEIQQREPTRGDIEELISQGYFVIAAVNQRVLQAETGYVGHAIFLFGFSDRGVRFHNPGPPATADSEIAWSLFEKAWAFPNRDCKSILAVKPPTARC
jgi:hypothetical protein